MKYMLFFTLATFALTACTQDDISSPSGGVEEATPLILTATIAGGADTRATVDNNWAGGEQIALQVNSATYYEYTVDKDGRMTGNFYWQNDEQSINIQGFYPSGKMKDGESCSVSTTQNIDGDYHNSDLLCSNLSQNVRKDNTYLNLTFYHQTAKVVINVKNDGYLSGMADVGVNMTIGSTDGIYTSATFESPISMDGETFLWSGDWTNPSDKKSITPHKATTTNGCVATFEALVIPQTVSTGTLFQFYVGDVGPFRYTVPAGGITWNAGTKYTYNVTLKAENKTVTVSSITAGGWGDGGSHNLETE